MNHRPLVVALAALSFGVSSVAFADDHDDRGRGPDHRDNARPNAAQRGRPDDRGGDRRMPRRDDSRAQERGAGPDHAFYRGGRLPAQFHDRQYVVDDWRGHRLSAPPRGYHWVQTGSDYVLVGIATGIIASVLLSQ